jgi:SAM-dependent methyltransferase
MVSHVFDKDYFHGGKKVGGYANEGYWDYPVHWTTFRKVMEYKPESVLELGAARGYILRRLEDEGVRVKGLEISEHCRLTRAINDIVTWDITQTPWPVKDKEFDLCLSVAVLEHIPEDKLPAVFAEMARTCKRGLHGIDLHDDDHFDQTHCTIRPQDFWEERLPPGHIGVDKEALEAGPVQVPTGTGVKLNIGSFTTMFHHGWRNVDRIPLGPWAAQHGYSFTHWDILNGIPYDENIVDLIFTSHMFEHLSYEEGARFLAECHRVMKPGGVLRVLVPDAGVILAKHAAGTLGDFDEMSETAAMRPTSAGKLYELLCAEHRAIYDAGTLGNALIEAGFPADNVWQLPFRKSASPVMQRETTDLYADLSLIMEATK